MGSILVVFTGGTIGSQVDANRIGLRTDNRYPLLEAYERKHPGRDVFETAEPFRILSENSRPFYMAELVRFLKKIDIYRYDGIIVTHGTDSLPYTAAFLGYYFGKAGIPMLLASSNYALGQRGSNGLVNFEAAVDFIREGRYAGVFVPFQNGEKEAVSIFLATRLLEADGYEDRFLSYDGGRLGRMERGRFVFEERKENPPIEAFLKDGKRTQTEWMEDVSCFLNVVKLQPYPGLNYEAIELEKGTGAVFHGTYHSGTVCMEGEKESAGLFVKKAKKAGIPVYFGPVKDKKEQYISAHDFMEAGGIPVYDCCEIAAYVKLLIGCGLGKQGLDLKAFMKETIYFEKIERTGRRSDL